MSRKLRCVFLGHRWTPGEATNEPGVQMMCARCGRLQSHTRFHGELTESPAERRRREEIGGSGSGQL